MKKLSLCLLGMLITAFANVTFAQQDYFSCQSVFDGFDDLYTHVQLRDHALYTNGHVRGEDNIVESFELLYLGFNQNLGCINFAPVPWSTADSVKATVLLIRGGVSYGAVLNDETLNTTQAFMFESYGANYSVSELIPCGGGYALYFMLKVYDAGEEFTHDIVSDTFELMDPIAQQAPAANAQNISSQQVDFVWTSTACTDHYNLFIAEESTFNTNGWSCDNPPTGNLLWADNLPDTTFSLTNALQPNTTYIWGVHSVQGGPCAVAVDTFTTGNSVGIASDFLNAPLSIYPNPVSESIRIDLPTHHPSGEIRVYSLDGREVLFETYQGQNAHLLNLSGLERGKYVVTLRASNAAPFYGRFVKL